MMSLSNQWVNNLVRINLDQNHLFLTYSSHITVGLILRGVAR